MKELRELLNLRAKIKVDENLSLLQGKNLDDRKMNRILNMLLENQNENHSHFAKSCTFRYNYSPLKINGDCLGRVASMDFNTGSQNNVVRIPAQLVVTCIGHHQFDLFGVKYDNNGVIPNRNGRIIGSKYPFCYAAGWAAFGPKGNLASTLTQSHLVADQILTDLETFTGQVVKQDLEIELKNSGINFISKKDWQAIEKYEASFGAIGDNNVAKLLVLGQ